MKKDVYDKSVRKTNHQGILEMVYDSCVICDSKLYISPSDASNKLRNIILARRSIIQRHLLPFPFKYVAAGIRSTPYVDCHEK